MFAIGSEVIIAGLVSRPDLNGKSATVRKFVRSSGRCGVEVDGGDGALLSVKPSNLKAPPTPTYVLPEVSADTSDGSYVLSYRDNRPCRPGVGAASVFKSVDGLGRSEAEVVDGVSFRLRPAEAKDVPAIPPPRGMVKGSDIPTVLAEMGGRMTREECLGMLLNPFNERHRVHKMLQEEKGEFVVLIEFDARVSESESPSDATLSLTVTLRSDGLGGGFPDSRRRIRLHTHFDNDDNVDFEEVAASYWVGSTLARSPAEATVRGLLPLGIDFVLRRPDYADLISRAKGMGKKLHVWLYDCSPVFGRRGDAESCEGELQMMMSYMHSAMRRYGLIELTRLPDGYTGEEVEADPESVLGALRRRTGKRMLITDRERCVPDVVVQEEAFRVQLDSLDIRWVTE